MRIRYPLLVAAVAAIAAIVLYARRGGSPQAAASAPVTEGATAAAAARTTAPDRARTYRTTPVVADELERPRAEGVPPALQPAYVAVEHAAKDCYRGRPAAVPIRPNGPDETIEGLTLEYEVVVEGGLAHATAVRVVDGALTDTDLQACILESIAIAEWESLELDGQLGTMQQNLRLGDLMRPDHGMPPESERSPRPTAPPPPELAAPLGTPPVAEPQDVHVYDPQPSRQPK